MQNDIYYCSQVTDNFQEFAHEVDPLSKENVFHEQTNFGPFYSGH